MEPPTGSSVSSNSGYEDAPLPSVPQINIHREPEDHYVSEVDDDHDGIAMGSGSPNISRSFRGTGYLNYKKYHPADFEVGSNVLGYEIVSLSSNPTETLVSQLGTSSQIAVMYIY